MNELLLTIRRSTGFMIQRTMFMKILTRRFPLKHQILFIKQLSVLMHSGIPLLPSLLFIKEQHVSGAMGKIMDHLVRNVENGQRLSVALKKCRKRFDPFAINLIAVGEVSGSLDQNLEYIVLMLKKKQLLKQKLISASIYPVFLIVATLGMIASLTLLVFPRILPVFKSVHYALPWTTRFLIFINNITQRYWPVMLFLIIAAAAILLCSLKFQKVRIWFHQLMLRIPLVRKLIQTYHITNICRTLGLLLNTQATLLQAFAITAETTLHPIYQKELDRLMQQLEKGGTIALEMRKNRRLFPDSMSHMVSIAEGTGKLSETFLYLSSVFDEEMDDLTKNLSAMVEPTLLILMGVLVGFVALSIITPIYGITQHLKT